MLLFRLFEMIKIGFFKIEGFFVGFKDRIFVRKSEKQKMKMEMSMIQQEHFETN